MSDSGDRELDRQRELEAERAHYRVADEAQLREKLEDAIDVRRFDADFPAGLDFKTIQYCIDKLEPIIKELRKNELKWVIEEGSKTNHCDSFQLQVERELVEDRIKGIDLGLDGSDAKKGSGEPQ